MANEYALAYFPPRDTARLVASIAFTGLLLLAYVGLKPFAPLTPLAPTNAIVSAQGDSLRQAIFLALFAPVLLAALMQRGLGAARAVPATLVLLLGWCLLSVTWSSAPDVTFRRAALAVIFVLSVTLSVDLTGPERAFRLWRWVLAGVLLVNWISIPLVETARHLPGEVDPGLVGDWRGLYGQKNSAGAVCALTCMIFLFTRNGRGNWIGWLVSLAAFVFLIMTRSKTSLGLLPIALAAGFLYRQMWRDGLNRALLAATLLLVLLAAGLVVALDFDAILKVLEDPTEFTGRTEIWQAIFAYIRDHPVTGAGFGTIANTGGVSPLHPYATSIWVEKIGDSHNGYLQLFVQLGAVGFALTLAAFLAAPMARFWPLPQGRDEIRPLLFALFVFVLLHNFTESDFLESDNGVWFAFLVMLGCLRRPAPGGQVWANR